MRQIANDVFQLPVLPRNAVNAYLVGTVLVDTGYRFSAGGLRKALEGRRVEAIVLTHAHGDHGGSAKQLSTELGVPVWVGMKDREATETGKAVKRDPFAKPGISAVAGLMADFPAVAVARTLQEGDAIADTGFTVLDTPGHSPGHISLYRESDKTLICGDVFFNMSLLTTVPGLRQPPWAFTPDPALNRESERKVAALEPAVAAFGHGPVITEGTAGKLSGFVSKLPAAP